MYNLLSSNDRRGLFDSDISVNSHRAGLLPWESILELVSIYYCRLQFKKQIYIVGNEAEYEFRHRKTTAYVYKCLHFFDGPFRHVFSMYSKIW
jgi:hypothetical protein